MPDQDAVARLNAALTGRYHVEGQLGEGGMATVYLAEDLKHRRRVALKVLKPELAAVVGGSRFLAEIETTANLQHPHILPLFDSGDADGLLFYVMPHVESESLRARLDRERQLPVDQAVRIATNVAEALDYAHRHGVIHRDIKPANILLLDGKPVVTDFGIALAVSHAGSSRLTETGLSLGTPHYMSPEQATGDGSVGPATDVWALGCVLYEMLVGEPPHTGSTPQAVLGKIITREPPSASEARKSVPPNVDAVLRKALEKVPADRFRSAGEFAQALANPSFLLAGRSPWEAPNASLPAWQRRTLANWQTASAVAVIGALGAAIGVQRDSSVGLTAAPVVSSILPPEGQDFSESESFGALSPDGMSFAFVSLGRRGERRLWIRALNELSARPLPGTEGAAAPFWSPDGEDVAFFRQAWLHTIEVDEGVVRRICAIPDAYSGSWGEAGTVVVAARAGIVRVDMAAATCEVAIAAQGVFDVRHPALLPDGRHVLFKWGLRDTHLGIGDLASGDVSILLSGATDPTFVPPGLLVFGRGAQDLAVTPLWAQSFDPESLTLVGDPVRLSDAVRTSQGVASYAVSPGGTLLYQPGFGDRGYLLTDRRGSVIDTLVIPGAWSIQWGTAGRYIATGNGSRPIAIYDLDRRLPTPLSGSSEWEDSWSPAWSPSDSLLAYAACTSTLACGIGVTRFADGRDTLVVPPDERYNVWPSSWSPSGRFLVYSRTTSFEPTGARIWALDLVDGRSELLFDQAPSLSTLEGAISPDGRWLAYRSDETGTWEVFVRPFMRAGASRRVSANGGRSPRWRADGGELFYQSPDGEVVAVSIIQGAEFAFASPVALFSAPGWSRHNFFDIGTSFDVSPDGQQFVVRMTATGTTAVLVRDWRALLR